MKTLANRVLMFAAGAVVFGTMAYGQTQTAQIPFAFRTSNGTLPAGNYAVNQLPGSGLNGVISLRNTNSYQSTLVMGSPLDINSVPDHASMVFACGSQGCALTAIRTPKGTFNYHAPRKSNREKETLSIISIPVVAAQGE